MKAAVRETRSTTLRLVAVLAASAACQVATAQQVDPLTVAAVDPAALALRGERSELATRIEVTRSTLPRLEGLDSATSGPRLDLSVLPPRRTALGPAFAMSGFAPPAMPLAPQVSTPMNVDVGLHLRHTTDSNYQVDVMAWRRTTQPDAYTLIQQHQPTAYIARVELGLGGMSKGFATDRGFVGMQLENGARLGLGRKNGGAMLYYRSKF